MRCGAPGTLLDASVFRNAGPCADISNCRCWPGERARGRAGQLRTASIRQKSNLSLRFDAAYPRPADPTSRRQLRCLGMGPDGVWHQGSDAGLVKHLATAAIRRFAHVTLIATSSLSGCPALPAGLSRRRGRGRFRRGLVVLGDQIDTHSNRRHADNLKSGHGLVQNDDAQCHDRHEAEA